MKYHNISETINDQIADVVLCYVQDHKDEYIDNIEKLTEIHGDKYYYYSTYTNSNTYCDYRDTLDLFNRTVRFIDKIKIKILAVHS